MHDEAPKVSFATPVLLAVAASLLSVIVGFVLGLNWTWLVASYIGVGATVLLISPLFIRNRVPE